MTYKIGNLDILQFTTPGGYLCRTVEVLGQNGGETQDGTTYRDVIVRKDEITSTLRPMSAADYAALLALLEQGTVQVTYTKRQTRQTAVRAFLVTRQPEAETFSRNGEDWFRGISFTLLERDGH